jgi:uroporphyrinogen III methyltransferase/synthase
MNTVGMVYLVGAGPGDPGLFTLRGQELLQNADVVVHDALVNPALLNLIKDSAEIIYGGKRSKNHSIPQTDLNQLLADKALEGKNVVRLKGGDPFTFGRGGEEAEVLAARGVPFEVVPGISSAVAVPAYAGIPITHRDHCSGFEVITGHEDPQKEESSIDWSRLAASPGTKIVLMGVERIGVIAEKLCENGMSASTEVAMIRKGTTGEQRTLVGTLGTIAELVKEADFKAPAVTVIGSVVNLRKTLNWFETRKLFGQRVVVTRTRKQASQLSKQLSNLGAEVLEIPTIKIGEPRDRKPLVEAIAGLNAYDWLVFTSPNGVDAFFGYFLKAFDDLRDIGGVRIAAVGPATAEKLKELHLHVDVTPKKYLTSEISTALKEFQDVENLRILLMRAEVANLELPKTLESMGAIVDDVACYRTVPDQEDLNGAAADLEDSGADWITFASSSSVENFHARFDLPQLQEDFPQIQLASIGPETSKAIKALGLEPDVEAVDHTINGLIEALVDEAESDQEETDQF